MRTTNPSKFTKFIRSYPGYEAIIEEKQSSLGIMISGIREFEMAETDSKGNHLRAYTVSCRSARDYALCPYSQGEVPCTMVRGRRTRLVQAEYSFGHEIFLELETRKFRSPVLNENGNHRLFYERFEMVERHGRFTKGAKSDIMSIIAISMSTNLAVKYMRGKYSIKWRTCVAWIVDYRPDVDYSKLKKVAIDDILLNGGRYVSIVLDHETRRTVEVIPGRKKEIVKAALAKYTSLEIITMDCADCYREGVAAAFAEVKRIILRVVDNFHCVQLLTKAVFKALYANKGVWMKELSLLPENFASDNKFLVPVTVNEPTPKKVEDFTKVKTLAEEGLTDTQIRERTGLSVATIAKYRGMDEPEGTRAFSHSDYPDYMDTMMRCMMKGLFREEIFQECKKEGMEGGKSGFNNFMRSTFPLYDRKMAKRVKAGKVSIDESLLKEGALETLKMVNSPKLKYNLVMRLEDLDKIKDEGNRKEAKEYRELIERSPMLSLLRKTALSLGTILMGDKPDEVDRWLEEYKASPFPKVAKCAENLEKQKEGMKNSIICKVSNGVLEGKNLTAKLIKRMAFGKASYVYLWHRMVLREMMLAGEMP